LATFATADRIDLGPISLNAEFPVMAITVEAVYENGVLKLSEPLPWEDGARVRVAVSSLDSPLLKAYGIMGFKGTAEEAEYFALHPGLLPEEGR
jgi:predicted DNA-binding antitoxin AbrB/MazE fold protein